MRVLEHIWEGTHGKEARRLCLLLKRATSGDFATYVRDQVKQVAQHRAGLHHPPPLNSASPARLHQPQVIFFQQGFLPCFTEDGACPVPARGPIAGTARPHTSPTTTSAECIKCVLSKC